MAIDTKLNLNNNKFEQSTGDILNLSGCTIVRGKIDSYSGYQISGTTIFKTLPNTLSSVYVGNQAGVSANNVGLENIGIGSSSSYYNTSGSYGVAIGNNSLYGNITGSYDVAVGISSLHSNTTGSYNVGLGYQAGFSNSVGNSNVFIGTCAGYTGTTSNKLYIANNATCNLIYGDFSTNIITLPSLKLCTTPTTGLNSDSILVWNTTDKQVKKVDSTALGYLPLTGGTVSGTIAASNIRLRAYQTLTSAASVSMNINISVNAKITLGHNTAFTLTNLVNGDEGNLIIINPSTYIISMINSKKIIGGGTFTAPASSTTIWSYTYDGTMLYLTSGGGYV